LAPRTPAQLLTAIGTSASTALSGTIVQSSALGLPSLPGDDSTASLSWQSYLTGSHSIRVWADGVDKQRLAVIGQLSEADVVHNDRDLWTYTSDTNSATHTVLGAGGDQHDSRSDSAEPPMTPGAVVARLLNVVRPTTSVTLGQSRMVANQPSYTLVIRPRGTGSTISKITIAVDSHHFVPLQVEVFGSSSSPAFHMGFTKISFSTPPASTFNFVVPRGANVSSNPFTDTGRHHDDGEATRAVPGHSSAATDPKVIGAGWTSVLELHNGLSAAGGFSHLLDQATTSVGSSGARLLHTALVNAVILSDGRVFVGAVQPTLLEHIATTTSN
jgi:outer membrane lipoprotein-sorting protein